MTGQPTFFEIGAPDPTKAKTFFGSLLGWELHPFGDGDEGWIQTPTIRGGLHGDDPERRIELYFAVPDIDTAISRVRELGGEADDPGPEEPEFGRFASCKDDQGVRFGLHQVPDGNESLSDTPGG